MNLSETNVFKLKYFNIHYPIISVVFLQGFSTLGSTGSIEKLKGLIREKSGSQFQMQLTQCFTHRVRVDNS